MINNWVDLIDKQKPRYKPTNTHTQIRKKLNHFWQTTTRKLTLKYSATSELSSRMANAFGRF